MARTIKDHDSRRREILDVAQQLFYQKGYEQTSIQDLLQAIGIAKGTFYHYFQSKQALLEELTDRMVDEVMRLIRAIVEDPALNALEKFTQIYVQSHHWKIDHRDFMLSLLRMYYDDENLRLRDQLQRSTMAAAVPLLTTVIEQGNAEGIFTTAYPRATAEISHRLLQNLAEIIAELMLHPHANVWALLVENVDAYQSATERILGATPGSLQIFDAAMIYQKWFQSK